MLRRITLIWENITGLEVRNRGSSWGTRDEQTRSRGLAMFSFERKSPRHRHQKGAAHARWFTKKLRNYEGFSDVQNIEQTWKAFLNLTRHWKRNVIGSFQACNLTISFFECGQKSLRHFHSWRNLKTNISNQLSFCIKIYLVYFLNKTTIDY